MARQHWVRWKGSEAKGRQRRARPEKLGETAFGEVRKSRMWGRRGRRRDLPREVRRYSVGGVEEEKEMEVVR